MRNINVSDLIVILPAKNQYNYPKRGSEKGQTIPALSARWLVMELAKLGIKSSRFSRGTGLNVDWLKKVPAIWEYQSLKKLYPNPGANWYKDC